MESVYFAPEKEFRQKVERLFGEQKERIQILPPEADIQHIGSTAIPHSMTKGDLDIQVRISTERFQMAVDELSRVNFNTTLLEAHIYGGLMLTSMNPRTLEYADFTGQERAAVRWRNYLMERQYFGIRTMILFVAVFLPIVGLIVHVKASGSVENTTFNQLTAAQIDSFKPLGLEISTGLSTESATYSSAAVSALNATNTLMKQFNGTSRNIQYAVISRKYGPNRSAYAPVDPALTKGDPHFTNNLFHSIPCYLITINGVDIPSASSPVGGSGALDAQSLQVIVDATNDNILLSFAIHPDH